MAFRYPLDKFYPVTSNYGNRVSPITGKLEFHNGFDISKYMTDPVSFIGRPIYAPEAGKINYAGIDNKENGAKGVRIMCGDIEFGFWHLDSYVVKTGQTVAKGQLLGYTGNSGKNTTAPHLHIIVKKGGVSIDNVVNPITVVPEWYSPRAVVAPTAIGSIGTPVPIQTMEEETVTIKKTEFDSLHAEKNELRALYNEQLNLNSNLKLTLDELRKTSQSGALQDQLKIEGLNKQITDLNSRILAMQEESESEAEPVTSKEEVVAEIVRLQEEIEELKRQIKVVEDARDEANRRVGELQAEVERIKIVDEVTPEQAELLKKYPHLSYIFRNWHLFNPKDHLPWFMASLGHKIVLLRKKSKVFEVLYWCILVVLSALTSMALIPVVSMVDGNPSTAVVNMEDYGVLLASLGGWTIGAQQLLKKNWVFLQLALVFGVDLYRRTHVEPKSLPFEGTLTEGEVVA